MKIQRFLGYLLGIIAEVFAPRVSRRYLKPWTAITLLILISIYTFLIDYILLTILVCIEIIILLIIEIKKAVKAIILIFLTYSMFIAAGLALQLFLEIIDIEFIVTNFLKICSLTLSSIIITQYIRIIDIVIWLAPKQPTIALIFSIAIKNFYVILQMLKNINDIYQINYAYTRGGETGLFRSVSRSVDMLKGSVYYALYLNIYTQEALLSRYWNLVTSYRRE
jgi:hypothetical protein